MTSETGIERQYQQFTRADLLQVVIAQQQALTELGGSSLQSQRRATQYVMETVAGKIVGDGRGNPGPILQGFLDAATGTELLSRCVTEECEHEGEVIRCEGCGEPARINLPPDWKAANALMGYVVPKATMTVDQLQDEFLEWVSQSVIDEFDLANQHDTPEERKQAFIKGVRDRLAADPPVASGLADEAAAGGVGRAGS